MGLKRYIQKRDFKATPEPKGKKHPGGKQLMFVVQKHDASRLHYDFRLEMEGVLKSWAVPKGPSLNPEVKRLAVQVEDHPYSYRNFEGAIPEGNYGAGEVIVWDQGTYWAQDAQDLKESKKVLLKGLKDGKLKFFLNGEKLKGLYSLSRMKNGKEWLLIKKKDEYASEKDVTIKSGSVRSKSHLSRDQQAPIKPMLGSAIDKPFDDKDWIYEIKWDGYRAIAEVSDEIQLYSRNFLDFRAKYPSVVEALKSFKNEVVVDGEVVALDENGKPSFQMLQNVDKKKSQICYVIFDILRLDGKDLTELPLIERKKILKKIFPKHPLLINSSYVEKRGVDFYKIAVKQDLEGIMAKNKNSRYYPGLRSKEWLKIKTTKRQETVICGFTSPRGSRGYFGALVLGVYKNGKLNFVGHTGSGFDDKSLVSLYKRLKPLIQKKSPFTETLPKLNGPVAWVKPQLVCEIKFSEWTGDNRMRHPIFMGLREDKKATEVVREQTKTTPPVSAVIKRSKKKLMFTNLDKIFWPKEKITKGDLIKYYKKIAPVILPYLKDRPESMKRHPNGINGESFFQKNIVNEVPDFVKTVSIDSDGKEVNYLVCQNEETLLYMANLGCIELNPWNSRLEHLDYPDYLIIDLDPANIAFEKLITVAQTVHKVLEEACAPGYCKTSGQRGLHVFIPLGGRYDYDQVKSYAELLMNIVHERCPDITSIKRATEGRKDKIYLDFLQNRYAQTLAAPYCVRPVAGAPVSTPLKWEEVKKGLDPKKFTMKTIFKRLQKFGDLWKPVLTEKVDLAKSLKCLEKSLKNKS